MRDLPQLLNLYRRTLLDNVLPFWELHAFDPNGGINTRIGDDGTLVNRRVRTGGCICLPG